MNKAFSVYYSCFSFANLEKIIYITDFSRLLFVFSFRKQNETDKGSLFIGVISVVVSSDAYFFQSSFLYVVDML